MNIITLKSSGFVAWQIGTPLLSFRLMTTS